MNKYKTISYATRITFLGGIIAIFLLLFFLIPDVQNWNYKSEEQKKSVKTKVYIILAIVVIVILSAFIGSRAHSKI